jgi:proliferating cell nuclear antigen
MFEAVFSKASTLKKIVDALKDFTTDINFECTATGIHINTMDSSNVAFICMMLDADGFDSYRCDEPQLVGLNMDVLCKVVKCGWNTDKLTLKLNKKNPDFIDIIFTSENRNSKYRIRLLDLTSTALDIPKFSYSCVIEMNSTYFKQQCINLKIMGDFVCISSKGNDVIFNIRGDTGKVKTTLKTTGKKDDDFYTLIDLKKEFDLSLSLVYLLKFTKATNLSNLVKMYLQTDTPMKMVYEIEDDNRRIGYVHYFLAPTINNEQ